MVGRRVARDALARVQARKRELAQVQVGMLAEQAHRLCCVDHRAPTDSDDEICPAVDERLRPGSDLSIRWPAPNPQNTCAPAGR